MKTPIEYLEQCQSALNHMPRCGLPWIGTKDSYALADQVSRFLKEYNEKHQRLPYWLFLAHLKSDGAQVILTCQTETEDEAYAEFHRYIKAECEILLVLKSETPPTIMN
jgi:hypothetical protein